MRQLIAGNWKMNGLAGAGAAIAGAVRQGAAGLACDLVICPPATLLIPLAQALAGSPVELGGQDCHAAQSGAHTGDIAAPMLRDAGARWVILGHSERRAAHGESDSAVHAKVLAAVAAGLAPIVCVGESEAERAAGRHEAVIAGQLAAGLPEGFAGVVAYEPIWAIGTGRTASLADIAAMHAFIRARLAARHAAGAAARILYGGSVKAENARDILAVPEVGGALVGGASLDAAAFLAIGHACAQDTCIQANRG
ncbi:MAG: triose-phosphate isomerase [Rhodospirillales bacterium]|nr:triose-phosphate isomerase [Rhodospirillales bacterium]MDE2200537.1 triose-phosphate isomerase [Rhodospirillales bacterium]MDE2574388.1 triose-phosphate isomerase [Rhodospirillales bacterium]